MAVQIETLHSKAASLRELHHGRRPLILPNAWDVASAQLVESAGFPVVATSSGAIAAALGYDDNDTMPTTEAFNAIARITRNVGVPVTGDIEAGYGLEPEELVAKLVEAGAVGCNLEDSDHHGQQELVDQEVQASRLAAIRQAAVASGIEIVINARVDLEVTDESTFDEATRRARAYLEAGADCIYPIRIGEEKQIGEFVQRVQGPVNIMFIKGRPPITRLAELGVARISLAGRLMRRAYAVLRESLAELHGSLEEIGS